MSKAKKKTEAEVQTFTDSGFTVPLLRVDPSAMFLRQHVANGELAAGRKFDCSMGLGGGAQMFVEFENPRAVYAVALEDIVKGAIAADIHHTNKKRGK